jgi:ubiquitin
MAVGSDEASGGQPLQVFVKTVTGKTMTVDVQPTDTVDTVRQAIQTKEGIPSNHQRLIFNGRQLKQEETIAESGLQNHSQVHMVLRLLGGTSRS